MQAGRGADQAGFTYIWALAALTVFAVGLAALGPQFSLEAQRERERELLRIGQLYAEALASYYRASPGSLKQYPNQLELLLEDPRFVGTVRHLRQLYPDPLQPQRPWGLLRDADGGIRGVYSTDARPPLRSAPLQLGSVALPPARHYFEWQFVSSNVSAP